MKSIKKISTFFVFISIVCTSYGQTNNSDSFIFRVWGRGPGGAFERALFRWDNSITMLQSRDHLRIDFYNSPPSSNNPTEFFRFDRDLSFNIQKTLGNSVGRFNIRSGFSNDRFWLGTQSDHLLTIGVNGRGSVNFLPDRCTIFYKGGNDGGTINISAANRTRYALFVEGGILSEDFALGPRNSWADFVLKSDYELPALQEVERYIKKHNRLPGMPSEKDVQKEGYSLHDMNVKLLQKVEELTLYIITQDKKIQELETLLKP